ncbi:hypothetical protein EU520_00405 [Candidatus Thorarchaeota archaeon]|nr:MAG: hypothetical protein EU520_00405 [Candidatus Thorarchaeota archaeon]
MLLLGIGTVAGALLFPYLFPTFESGQTDPVSEFFLLLLFMLVLPTYNSYTWGSEGIPWHMVAEPEILGQFFAILIYHPISFVLAFVGGVIGNQIKIRIQGEARPATSKVQGAPAGSQTEKEPTMSEAEKEPVGPNEP